MIGIILSAGNQKRFKKDTYKSLVEINGKTLLEANISLMVKYVHKVYVVISNKMSVDKFEKITKKYSNRVEIIKIKSGKGCGHAVLQTLNLLKFNKFEQIYLIWGDSLQSEKIYEKIKNINQDIIVPVCKRENPYVRFYTSKNNKIVYVSFSKYGDKVGYNGFQDLSIFKFNGLLIRELLQKLSWRKKELIFLDLFNKYLIGSIIEFKKYKKNSFNTFDEYKELLNDYNI